jgi:flagellar motor component MotA
VYLNLCHTPSKSAWQMFIIIPTKYIVMQAENEFGEIREVWKELKAIFAEIEQLNYKKS